MSTSRPPVILSGASTSKKNLETFSDISRDASEKNVYTNIDNEKLKKQAKIIQNVRILIDFVLGRFPR